MDAPPSDPDEVRHRLYEIMKADAPFDEKVRLALDLGRAYLGVDCGYVSRIDVDTDHYEVIVSTADDDGLVPAGHTTNLNETYCFHVVERGSSLAVHDVRTHEYIDADVDAEDGTTVTMQVPHVGTRSVEERPQIQRAPDMYQLAFRAAESPLALLDGAGRIVDVNDRGVALLDRGRSDILGSDLAEITEGSAVQSVDTVPMEEKRPVARETATAAEREVGPVSSGGWEHRLVRLREGDEGGESV